MPATETRRRPARTAGGDDFAALGVDRAIASRLARDGITTPRPIQVDTVAAALDGRDVCGRAPTGSGKTLAFALPAVHVAPGQGRPVVAILAPTRELALQITEVVRPLGDMRGLRTWALIGGTNIKRDIAALKAGVDIVIGCPGRMVDLVQRKALKLGDVRLAVLDEADRMADMGFIPDVTRLLDATRCADGQLLLFSATLDDTTAKLEARYSHDPVRVDVGAAPTASGDVSHTWYTLDRPDRREVVQSILADHRSAIVFCRTKRGADRLAKQLTRNGCDAAAIHGDRSQNQRQRALAAFTEGRTRVLVATDIAARGIHVDDVDVVVHYDLPAAPEDYVHRSGRTGRAGADGAVVALVCRDSEADGKALARKVGVDVTWARHGGGRPTPVTERPQPAAQRQHTGGPRGSRGGTAAPSGGRRGGRGRRPRRNG
ncbi:DEAD/DEAH box helicase [Euzebya sp.]|uniref:DEAD/DEAH box helicase n=1 Tax=Euzebya sp. TaxID=1971409 RepID=UPI0035176453